MQSYGIFNGTSRGNCKYWKTQNNGNRARRIAPKSPNDYGFEKYGKRITKSLQVNQNFYMKTLKAVLLSFLTFILFSASCLSQEVLPDSLPELTGSTELIKRAKVWQQAMEFYWSLDDSVQYNRALEEFEQLPLEN